MSDAEEKNRRVGWHGGGTQTETLNKNNKKQHTKLKPCVCSAPVIMPLSLSSLFKPKFSKPLNYEIHFPHWYSDCWFWVRVGAGVVVTDRQLSAGSACSALLTLLLFAFPPF